MKEVNKAILAIGEVQQELQILARKETADVGKFSYRYTSFPAMWVELKPLLKKHGLVVIQSPVHTDGVTIGDFLTTTISHNSGDFLTYTMRLIVTRDDPQGIGSAITYAERYMLKTIFKIVTDDEDNDATTQMLATGEMKKDWVRAYTVLSKKQAPDHIPTNLDFINFMTETYGKHPSKILAREHQQVLDLINAFS